MTAVEQPAYPIVSSLPSSQSNEQSHLNAFWMQVIPPDLQVNHPSGHNYNKDRFIRYNRHNRTQFVYLFTCILDCFFFLTHCKRRIIYPTSNWNLEGADLSEIFNSNKKQFLKSFGVWFFLGEVARSREPYEFPLKDFSWTHPGYKRRGIFNYISLSFFTLITYNSSLKYTDR